MKKITHSLLVTAFILASAQAQATSDHWQVRMLHQPSDIQLALETKGRVFIYDGLTDVEVGRAVDEQFERMGSMMFVRTVLTDASGQAQTNSETGEVLVEDDGCD